MKFNINTVETQVETLVCQGHNLQGKGAYKNPVAKIAVMSIFFFNGKRSLQTQGIGSIRIVKSEMTLKIPVA